MPCCGGSKHNHALAIKYTSNVNSKKKKKKLDKQKNRVYGKLKECLYIHSAV